MNLLVNLFRGLQSLVQKRRVDRELDEELAAFASASAADKERAGMTKEAATRAARIERARTLDNAPARRTKYVSVRKPRSNKKRMTALHDAIAYP